MNIRLFLALPLLVMGLTPCAKAEGKTIEPPSVSPVKALDAKASNPAAQPPAKAHSTDPMASAWKAWRAGDVSKALRHWEQFVQQLDPDTTLLFAGVYRNRTNAFRTLRGIGETHRGLLLRRPFQKKPAFYVLLAPSPEHLETMRTYLRRSLHIPKPRGRAAAFFQQGTTHPAQSRNDTPASKSIRSTGHARKRTKKPAPISRSRPRVQPVRTRSEPEPDAAKLVMLSQQALEHGNRTEALRLLGKALHQKPDMREARLLYARLWIEENRPEESLLALAPLLNKQENDWRPWFWSGTALLLSNQLEAAARALDESLARDGKRASTWIQRAIVEQRRGRPEVSLQMLKMAEAMHPGLPETWLNMAIAQEALGQRNAAIRSWQAFIRLSDADGRTRQSVRKTALQHLAELAGAAHPIRSSDKPTR